jgi:DNA-binding transcriptional LysR family regulator
MNILAYLETFSAVVENGSFTAAADALGISKPVNGYLISNVRGTFNVRGALSIARQRKNSTRVN